MRDQILNSFLKDFVDENGLTHLEESEAFEHFAAYSIIARHHPEPFEPEDVRVGGPGSSFDGAAVLVCDHIVSSIEELEHFKNELKRLEVKFVFVEAKTSANFDGKQIGAFIQGVRQFFERPLSAEANSSIASLYELKEHIFNKLSIYLNPTPTCHLYYVCTGKWDPASVRPEVDMGCDDLRKLSLFSTVEFTAVDAEALKRFYRQSKQKLIREIVFDKFTILPAITNVQEAYIGILPSLEYLKLVTDDEGELNKRIFCDNVRDFQGLNPVNLEIQATLQESQRSDRFALLNNGVTIVARDVNKVGTKFKLSDYQIVNGCQTSHVLFYNRASLTNHVWLPIKLIVTNDTEVTNQVIQGTNRQTEVKSEALESLQQFHRDLEEYYLASSKGKQQKLYYERRSKQYEYLQIPKHYIITLATQTKCFIAMFLNEPQSTHRYYGELLESYRGRMFQESHSPMPYFVSGLAFMAVAAMFAEAQLPRELRAFRFQLLMAFRLLQEK